MWPTDGQLHNKGQYTEEAKRCTLSISCGGLNNVELYAANEGRLSQNDG